MKVRALIVDDEPLARRAVRRMLGDFAWIEVQGECADGEEAVREIRAREPDLVFLDVQMPELNGLQVVRRVGMERMPATVFITAFDRYALQAFDLSAIDYLLKPLNPARFQAAVERARDRLEGRLARSDLKRAVELLGGLVTEPRYLERLSVPEGGRIVLITTGEIDWIEADGNYVQLHVGKRRHVLRDSMANLEKNLDPREFLRIHRCTIVNVSRIKELQPWFHGHHLVVLQDGQTLRMSRYQLAVAERLGLRCARP